MNPVLPHLPLPPLILLLSSGESASQVCSASFHCILLSPTKSHHLQPGADTCTSLLAGLLASPLAGFYRPKANPTSSDCLCTKERYPMTKTDRVWPLPASLTQLHLPFPQPLSLWSFWSSLTTISQVHFHFWGFDFIIPLAWNVAPLLAVQEGSCSLRVSLAERFLLRGLSLGAPVCCGHCIIPHTQHGAWHKVRLTKRNRI